ncbi:tetratricopeptide repeat protein [Sphingomonas floccifaciens]|uniref:Tetratricopeptide repeat protein n=1 Tax=Sphingomonas floccifaciens TaxID=1844115 RepID=A0ABW4NFW7_9SPHN
MGWLALFALMLLAFAAMLRLGVPRTLASFLGAALMLGAAGYALQGRPGLAGAPVRTATKAVDIDPSPNELRLDMFGRYTTSATYYTAGTAFQRMGDQRTAVNLYLGAINAQPNDAGLWTALGDAYVLHDRNTVSPPARLAFDQAIRLAPTHPGPPFFLGLAYVRAGQFREGARWWRRAYALSPEQAPYRAFIGQRLALVDMLLASPAGRDAP